MVQVDPDRPQPETVLTTTSRRDPVTVYVSDEKTAKQIRPVVEAPHRVVVMPSAGALIDRSEPISGLSGIRS
jgi:hypothetical protein